ncbi:MAG TPA: LacI family DNA-binding transcriptional regulator [Anaerolineaceae bacterium]|nr:LacI family DNA-binding transcriptional regulator [Anaerolineaceae bacterium]HPN50322.1 LacI family DNA-binding transcriptional regulator [Anaerolineaceae bacterium]
MIKHKRPNIKQVALAAGVSTQTVSRVMNDRPDVSPETRERVQKIIGDLGYQPSALARSLIQQRSYTLGVVTAGLKYIGPARTLSGITNAAEEFGYSLLLKELPRFDVTHVLPILQEFISHHADGVIWAVPEVGDNREWLNQPPADLEVPMVFLTMQPRENIPVVSIDNYQGGRMAMSHLLDQGYRHIGHISGPLDWWEARQRKAAWQDALQENNIEVRESYWVEGNWSSASGAQAIEKLFQQYPEMDAVFAANDQMALSVIQAAYQRNKRIPQDIGVVGFDNISESPFFCPALTTVQSEQYTVGRMAVEEMIKIIEPGKKQEQESDHPTPIMLTPTLVVRQSSLKQQVH